MQHYNEYRDAVGISQSTMVQVLRPHFPSFTKSICSIVERPEKYGCCLTPEAEVVLTETFGKGPGLAFPPGANTSTPPVPKHCKRERPNRITVWLHDDLYLRLMSLKTEKEYPTIQALAEAALRDFIERESYAERD